ncbi:MAG: hypothetical protein AB8B72_14560 [Crocinitomicaceae bacterium]
MKLILASIICFSSLLSFGTSTNPPDSTLSLFQKAELKLLISDGRTYFNEDNYRLALIKFREALNVHQLSAEANYWVAECHLGLTNYQTALKYALRAKDIDEESVDELYYVLGSAYHKLGDFKNAQTSFKKALQKVSKSRKRDLRIETKIEECDRGILASKTPFDIEIKALGPNINSKHDDYAGILSKDGKTLYFSSRQAQNTGGGFSSGDSKYFSDIFISDWDSKTSTWLKANNLDDRIIALNSEGFDDISFLSSDEKSIYLSVNTEGILSAKVNTQSTDIFISELGEKNNWSAPKQLDRAINSIGFEASPSFTADGNTLFFVSERSGGYGRGDIWTSSNLNGRWSKPVNLGSKINTPFQETTVFVSGDGQYLFFSSDGHKGFGGYDVYVSKKFGDSWSAPVNLGFPINGVTDETHFTYYPHLHKGLYSKLSTEENGGIGYRDIFEIDLSKFDLSKLF